MIWWLTTSSTMKNKKLNVKNRRSWCLDDVINDENLIVWVFDQIFLHQLCIYRCTFVFILLRIVKINSQWKTTSKENIFMQAVLETEMNLSRICDDDVIKNWIEKSWCFVDDLKIRNKKISFRAKIWNRISKRAKSLWNRSKNEENVTKTEKIEMRINESIIIANFVESISIVFEKRFDWNLFNHCRFLFSSKFNVFETFLIFLQQICHLIKKSNHE